jgi:hypothetical protein
MLRHPRPAAPHPGEQTDFVTARNPSPIFARITGIVAGDGNTVQKTNPF